MKNSEKKVSDTHIVGKLHVPPQVKPVLIVFYFSPRDWRNGFAETRFCYIQVLFHMFCYNWGREYSSLTSELSVE